MPGSPFAPYRRRPRRSVGSTVLPIPSAPATPNTPSPADTATAYFTLLSWVSAGATNFDVYLDTVNPPVTIVAPKIQSTSYVPTLLPATRYYWKIVAFNAGGSATGPVWSFLTPAATDIIVALAGAITTSHTRVDQSNIHEVLGASPNTATFVFDTPVTGGQEVQIGLGSLDDDALQFGGEVQMLGQTYIGTPDASTLYPVDLIDPTFRLNKRRPFGTWVNVSATVIALKIRADFAPDFTTNHVQANLPAISINFDGSADYMTCMRSLASAISTLTTIGKTKVDYADDIHLFLTPDDADAEPDPIDLTHPPLNDPSPIQFTTDHSQLRTRGLGKGLGVAIPTDLVLGETIIPVPQAVSFNPNGGKVIAGTTDQGAQTQRLTYTSVQLGGGGTLAGPGVQPSVAVTAVPTAGGGLSAGLYGYAYSWVTASGRTIPAPLATATTGILSAPVAAPAASSTPGPGLSEGAYSYGVSFLTAASGETPAGPQVSVTTDHILNPTSAPSDFGVSGSWPAATHSFLVAYAFQAFPAGVSTALSPTTAYTLNLGDLWTQQVSGSVPNDSRITNVTIYSSSDGGTTWFNVAGAPVSPGGGFSIQFLPGVGTGLPAPTNTAVYTQVNLSAIPVGPLGTTQRRLYRTLVGAGQLKLLATIPDNTTTTYTDSTADGSLGANAQVINSAVVEQVNLSGLGTGPTGTISREIYRTAVGASQLKFVTTIADNTTTTFTDSVPDASLGGNAPTSDTSALTQPVGQINAGAVQALTAGSSAFQMNGGWASAGQNVFRYTGISGNTLTGIPASGPGSIVITIPYGNQIVALPALNGINGWNGIPLPMAKGSSVNIWVQVDDLAAQSALGALELDEHGNPTDGIREYLTINESAGEALITAIVTADLATFSRPIVEADYYTRDVNSKPGSTVSIDLAVGKFNPLVFTPVFNVVSNWGLVGDFTIQDVQVTFDGPALYPLRHVKASSVSFTLADLLRRVVLS